MKFQTSLLALFGLVGVALADFPPASVFDFQNAQNSIFNNKNFTETFMITGTLDRTQICMDMSAFCDGNNIAVPARDHPEVVTFTCWAATRAMSQFSAAYSIKGTVTAIEDIFGTINQITLSTEATSSALVTGFTKSAVSTSSTSSASVVVGAQADVNFGFLAAAAANAAGFSDATGYATSSASITQTTTSSTSASQFVDVHVEGLQLTKFTGNVGTSSSGFVEASSSASAQSVSTAAARSFQNALADARAFFFPFGVAVTTETQTAFDLAFEVTNAFGSAVASAVSQVTIGAMLSAEVLDQKKGVSIVLSGFGTGNTGFVGTSC